MQVSDYIAIGSAGISLIAIVLSIVTNTKKYELAGQQKSELLDWFYKTTNVLIAMRLNLLADPDYKRVDDLTELSTLIEYGRFYFPNIDMDGGYGKEKPSAYRGQRDMTLEFLVYSYDIVSKSDAYKYLDHLERLQRLYTSRIFDVLSPKKFNKKIRKNTSIALDKGLSLDDFLKSDPNKFDYFRNPVDWTVSK